MISCLNFLYGTPIPHTAANWGESIMKTGKIDKIKATKRASRQLFCDDDMRTRVVPIKKRYSRKIKHRNMEY